MEHGFSVLMFIFGGAILLYALLMIATGEKKLLPYRVEKTMKKTSDDKAYVRALGRVVALIALAPIVGGGIAYIAPPLVTGIVTVGAFVLLLWLGTKMMKGAPE